jgi:hypothetical protein
MNGEDSGDENSLKGFYAYKNTFDENAIWMDIPKHGELQVMTLLTISLTHSPVTFINTTNPYLDPGTPDFDTMSTTSVDTPGESEPRLFSSWRTHSNFHSVTSTPSSMGPDLGPTNTPMCYTPDIEALPPLMHSMSSTHTLKNRLRPIHDSPAYRPPSYFTIRFYRLPASLSLHIKLAAINTSLR